MGEASTCVTLGVVDELVVPIMLGSTFVDRFSKSIHTAEKKILLYQSLPPTILMVHAAKSEAENEKLEIRQDKDE